MPAAFRSVAVDREGDRVGSLVNELLVVLAAACVHRPRERDVPIAVLPTGIADRPDIAV